MPKKSIKSKSPKQSRSMATKEAIVEAARLILTHDGLKSFNTNRIAERAGVSVGSLYQYFPNKQSILVELYEQHKYELLSLLEESIGESKNLSLEVFIERVVHSIIKLHKYDQKYHYTLSHAVAEIVGNGLKDDVKEKFRLYITSIMKEYEVELRYDVEYSTHIFLETIFKLVHFVTDESSPYYQSEKYLSLILEQSLSFLVKDYA